MTVPRRKRVYLDTMVIGHLAHFDKPRRYVRELRRNGADILVCPSVLKEVGLRTAKHRRRAVQSILIHCTGITKVKSGALMGAELNNAFLRKPPPDEPPVRSVRELVPIFSRPQLPGQTAFFASVDHYYFLDPKVLQAIDHVARGTPRRLFKDLGFRSYFFRVLTDRIRIFSARFSGPWGSRPFEINDQNLEAILPMWGFMMAIVLSAVNEYRAFTKTLTKGSGSLSDFDTIVEAAYGDVLLTRDRELFEAFQLVKTVFPHARLSVEYLEP